VFRLKIYHVQEEQITGVSFLGPILMVTEHLALSCVSCFCQNFYVHVQGGVINRGEKCFFSKNRPSSLIEAFGSPEKGWVVVS
jgi:hypothetical protein